MRAVDCIRPDKKIRINIGDDSSMAHNVGFKVIDTTNKEAVFNIGSRVFVGINSTLEEGITINSGEDGNYTAIGFGAKLKKGSTVGSSCIIGDGAEIGESIIIPSNRGVLPGMKVTKETMGLQITMKDFMKFNKKSQQEFKGLVILQDESDRKNLNDLSPALAFLNRFNDHVLEDNHSFPTMYRFIKKFHGIEHVRILECGQGHMVNIDLPKNKIEFLYHYYQESINYQEAKQKGENYGIKKYPGEFTRVEIDDSVKMAPGSIMYNIGETKIKGNTVIDGFVVNRSGDELGSLEIEDSRISHGVVFHAKGLKKLTNSKIDRWVIVHGATEISNITVGEKVMLHNTKLINNSQDNKLVDTGTTIVGATIEDSTIGGDSRILGYRDPINITNSYIPAGCVIRDGVDITNSTNIEPGTEILSGSNFVD